MELKTSYKQVENTEQNGIELYFEAIPTKEEREALKSEGWRWNFKKSCWYKRKDAPEKQAKKAKWQDITAFEVVTDYEKFKSLIPLAVEYINKESEAARQKDIEYYFKKYIMLYTCDHYIILLENDFALSKTLWYDDETEAPENTFENFKLYNMKNTNFRFLENYIEERHRLRTEGIASGGYDYKGIYLYKTNTPQRVGVDWTDGNNWASNKQQFLRYLTQEEEQQFIKVREQQKADYIERLERYWKRYGEHVHWSGYWVNR